MRGGANGGVVDEEGYIVAWEWDRYWGDDITSVKQVGMITHLKSKYETIIHHILTPRRGENTNLHLK